MEWSSDSSFAYKNEVLCCENVPLNLIQEELLKTEEGTLSATPLYVYSRKQLSNNIQEYQKAVRGCGLAGRVRIFYAVKANANAHLLTIVRDSNCGAVTVSGLELKLALHVGFDPANVLLNGNGKQSWEIDLALANDCMLNIDSLFDAENIAESARRLKKKARVLLRINPGLKHSSTPVHRYLATALKDSKFGIPLNQLDTVINFVNGYKNCVELIGLHCHVGSTIRDASIYSEIVRLLAEMASTLKSEGHPIKYLNVGGGLAINYLHQEDESNKISTKNDLIAAAASSLPAEFDLIIEPGRSIMANTGVLVSKVLGVKERSDSKAFLIVDAAMNDLIRPSFYDAYHHVLPVRRQMESEVVECDVVGPVCESGDFLAKNRKMQRHRRGELIAIMDVGAYGMAMASSYNMRGRSTEILVNGDDWKVIRRRETFDSLIQSMNGL